MINVLTTEPEFMFKFTWDREWLKKLKGDHKENFFKSLRITGLRSSKGHKNKSDISI